jgi:hypothetical protein
LAIALAVCGCSGDAESDGTGSTTTEPPPQVDATTAATPNVITQSSSSTPTTNVDSGPPTSTGSSASETDYDVLLESLDVAVAVAPAAAVHLGNATLCGWDQLGGPSMSGDKIDADGRQCFVAAHRAGTAAVFVNLIRDNEGATVPIVFRTEAGQTTMYWDWTKSLSSEQWRTEPCTTLYVGQQPDEAAPLVFSCTQWEGANPA